VWLGEYALGFARDREALSADPAQKSSPAQARFEKMMESSPVFDPLFEKYGDRLGALLAEKVEVVEGDVSQPNVGMDREQRRGLAKI